MALHTNRRMKEVSSGARKGSRRAPSTRQTKTRGLGDLLASIFGSGSNEATTSADMRSMPTGTPFMPATLADITALRNAASIATR
jgi:hypothetical protein